MLFLRVIAWYGAEKISLKKSCFYLYIRRRYESGRHTTTNTRYLISLCAQYFFAISYKILLQASHKLYICSIAQIIAYVVNISLVIISSVKYNNILIVKLFSSIAFLLQPLLYTLFTEKRYRKCYSKGKYELKGRWDGFFQNLAFFINNNTDIVLITLLLNLNEVSVYSVYMLVINGMKSVVLSISTGFQSILGRKLAQQNTVKIKEFMKKYFYFILIVSLIGFGTIILLIRQFVCIYIGNNSDYSYENIILRTYFRPAMWNYVYKRFGYSDVIQWVFIISFIIFIFGILCSILYVLTLQRFVNKVSGKLYEVVRIKYLLFEKFCLMIGEKKDNR